MADFPELQHFVGKFWRHVVLFTHPFYSFEFNFHCIPSTKRWVSFLIPFNFAYPAAQPRLDVWDGKEGAWLKLRGQNISPIVKLLIKAPLQ